MAEMKTKKTVASVDEFLATVADEGARKDSHRLCELMEKATGAKAAMWGSAIVGFGSRVLKYESGRELDWMEIGFSPRKANLTLYVTLDEEILARLGKHKRSKGCLHIKKLSDVDEGVLVELMEDALTKMR